MRQISLAFLFTLFVGLTACGDDDITIDEVTGRVFQGTAANGYEDCGWLIAIGGQDYVPNVLNSQFREENLQVFLKVEFLNEPADCGAPDSHPARLRIEQIQRVE